MLTKKKYGFWGVEDDKKVTKYNITLDECPLFNPPSWLQDLILWWPWHKDLDLQNSSLPFVSGIREVESLEKLRCF